MSKVDVDAEIDEWKRSDEFNNLPHGDDLLNDFEKMTAKVKSKDWFNAVISDKTIKEYHDLMQIPFMERDEKLRLTYERHIATSVLAQYADKDDVN